MNRKPKLDTVKRIGTLCSRNALYQLARRVAIILFLAMLVTLILEAIFGWEFLKNYQTYLIIAVIIFGALALWLNRQKFDMKAEVKHEELEEAERKKEFGSRFPRINRIPVVRWFIRWMYKEGWVYVLGLIICILLYLGFGLYHLGQFETVDEPKWLNDGGRVDQLYDGIREGDWEKTYINDKPGVIPSYLSGIFVANHNINDYNFQTVENYFFLARLPILLFNALILIIIYWLLSRLFNKNIAILSTYSISVCPTIIGFSQVVNPDATLWSLSFVSILAYFCYLKFEKTRYLYISGIFLGLASLSKYFANYLYCALFIIAVIYIINTYKQQPEIRSNLSRAYLDIFKIWGIALIVVFVLFPATWIDPELVLKQTILSDYSKPFMLIPALLFIDMLILRSCFLKFLCRYKKHILIIPSLFFLLCIIAAVANIFSGYSLFNVENILMFYGQHEFNFLQLSFMNFYHFILSLPLVVLLFLLIFLITRYKSTEFTYASDSFVIIILIFLFSSAGEGLMALNRYQLLLFPLYLTLAAMGFYVLAKQLSKKYLKILVSAVFIVFILLPTILATPFYYTYTNFLNYKHYVINEAWGQGGYELAQKANDVLPDNATVWSDREGFNIFYKGPTEWRGVTNPFDPEKDIDYLVLTYGGNRIFRRAEEISRRLYTDVAKNTPILDLYASNEGLLSIYLNNNKNNYVKLVEMPD